MTDRTCLRGHPWEGNRMVSLGIHGKPQSRCRLCHSARMKARYHADAAYREHKRAKRLESNKNLQHA